MYWSVCACVRVCCKLLQSCHTLCNPMACSLQGSSVHEILQARILGWVAISFRGSSSDLISDLGIKPVSPELAGGLIRVPDKKKKKSPEIFHLQRCVLGNVKAPRCWQERATYTSDLKRCEEREVTGACDSRGGTAWRGGDCGRPSHCRDCSEIGRE